MEAIVAIADYLYRGDAEIARAHLAGEGITAFVRADDEGGLNPGFFSEYRVVLLVAADDAAAAREILGIEPPLQIPDQIRRAMLAHSAWAYPDEACGLLAGDRERVGLVFCLTNRAASPNRYKVDPREHYGAMRYAERQEMEIIGAWHSHPNGPAEPSATDVAEAPGGDWVTVVVGDRARPGEAVRAFITDGDAVTELTLTD